MAKVNYLLILRKWKLIFIGIVIFIACIFIYRNYYSEVKIKSHQSTPTPTQEQNVESTSQSDFELAMGMFKKREEINPFSLKKIYPNEVTNQRATNLLDFRCADHYKTNSVLSQKFTYYHNGYGKFENMTYCQVKDTGELVILQYSVRGPTMIVWTKPKETDRISISTFDLACSMIQLSQNKLYIQCRGGQGPVWNAIHRVDLDSGEDRIIRFCSQGDSPTPHCIENPEGVKNINF